MNIYVPDDEWCINSKHVVNAVMKGTEGSTLPPDLFVNALYENFIVKDNNCDNVVITIPKYNRKRFVYGEVSYTNHHTFSIAH